MSACPANGTVTNTTSAFAAASWLVVPSTRASLPRASMASRAAPWPFSAERDPMRTCSPALANLGARPKPLDRIAVSSVVVDAPLELKDRPADRIARVLSSRRHDHVPAAGRKDAADLRQRVPQVADDVQHPDRERLGNRGVSHREAQRVPDDDPRSDASDGAAGHRLGEIDTEDAEPDLGQSPSHERGADPDLEHGLRRVEELSQLAGEPSPPILAPAR